jgi:PAS domain S-box-containing protein
MVLPSNLRDLIDTGQVQTLFRSFTRVTGVTACIMDNQGNPVGDQDTGCNLHTNFHQTRGRAACQGFYADLCQRAVNAGRMLRVTCPFDLTVGLAPISVNNQVLALLKCGYVFHRPPSPARVTELADRLQVEVAQYRKALMQQRMMSEEDFAPVLELGWEIAQTISRVAYQTLTQRKLEAQLTAHLVDQEKCNGRKVSEVEEDNECYRRLFESAPLVAYSLDKSLHTLSISPFCHKVFGLNDVEIGQDHFFWDRHIHPEDQQWVRFKRERRLKEKKAFTLEYRSMHRDGSVHHIINHIIPVVRDNKIQRIDGFIFDITSRKCLEQQLALNEKIKLLSDMSLSVAHEIRNPLTSIGGFARLLDRRMSTDDPNRPHLEIILKEVARLEGTLTRVLDGLKPIRLNLIPGDINMSITKVLNQTSYEFHHRGIQLNTNLAGDIPAIEMDRHLMEQGLRSILKSILQEVHTSGELIVSTFCNHRHVTIEIKGFVLSATPTADNQLLFPFYHEPAFDNGFGLPLSQQIITEHGGNVVFKKEYNKPTSLVITLPIPSSERE